LPKNQNIEPTAKDVYTKIIYLKHSTASHIQKVLKPLHSKIKIPNSKLTYQIFQNKILSDDITNSIIIVGEKKFVLTVANIVKNIDIAQYQVYVKTKIVQINQQKATDIGVKYGLAGANSNSAGLRTFAANLGGKYKAFETDGLFQTTPMSKGFLLGATVNLLNINGALDIVSQPSLLCVNSQKSTIYIGQTKSIQMDVKTVENGTTVDKSFSREDIGLTLSVIPRVLDDKRVVLAIEASIEDINGATTNGQPDTSKKTISTTAIVDTASSVILGGLVGQKDETIKTKVPFWGDIPFLGALFTNTTTTKEKTTLAIIVTPYIVPKGKSLSYITDKLSELQLVEQQYIERLNQRLKDEKN
jgi:general secretion pathway protein D